VPPFPQVVASADDSAPRPGSYRKPPVRNTLRVAGEKSPCLCLLPSTGTDKLLAKRRRAAYDGTRRWPRRMSHRPTDAAAEPDVLSLCRLRQRCCAVGNCCHQVLSKRTIHDIRTVLRSALSTAVVDERMTRNPAALVKVSPGRKRKPQPWSIEDARKFLVSAKEAGDPFYAAYVLILGPRSVPGEVLGLGLVGRGPSTACADTDSWSPADRQAARPRRPQD
jgi:hypothetical protein